MIFRGGGGDSRTLPPLLICMMFSRLKLSNLERTKLVEGSVLFWVFDSAHVVMGSCLAPWNRFKPSSKIFLLTVPRQCIFCGSFMLYFYLVFVMLSCASVYWCLVVTCWERAKLLALFCDVYLWICHFSNGMRQRAVWWKAYQQKAVWCSIMTYHSHCDVAVFIGHQIRN